MQKGNFEWKMFFKNAFLFCDKSDLRLLTETLFSISLPWLFLHVMYQNHRSHKVLFCCVHYSTSLRKTRRIKKRTQTKYQTLKQFTCFFAFSGSLAIPVKKDEIFMRICTFYGWNIKVCVMSVMFFYFPLRAREEMIY